MFMTLIAQIYEFADYIYMYMYIVKIDIIIKFGFLRLSFTSHGKGAVDGVGGTVKRAVHNAIMTRRYLVKSAAEYAACAQELVTGVQILHTPGQEIERLRPALDDIWTGAISIPATHSVHCVRTVDVGQVTLAKYTQQPAPQSHVLIQPPSLPISEIVPTAVLTPEAVTSSVASARVAAADIKPGSYVAIPVPTDRGRSILYVAAVYSIRGNQMQVKFLRKTETSEVYRNADIDDTSLEEIKNVLFVCPEPEINMAGTTRLRYNFQFTDPQRDMMSKFSTK
jgi:hypothetical protein